MCYWTGDNMKGFSESSILDRSEYFVAALHRFWLYFFVNLFYWGQCSQNSRHKIRVIYNQAFPWKIVVKREMIITLNMTIILGFITGLQGREMVLGLIYGKITRSYVDSSYLIPLLFMRKLWFMVEFFLYELVTIFK